MNTNSLVSRILVALGLRKAISGAALHATVRGIFVDVYPEDGGWYFSWFDEDHTRGEVKGPFLNAADAEYEKRKWILSTRGKLVILNAVKA